jgi:putative ABC transport system substrate-binding protein
MKRREFITLLGGAQPRGRWRRLHNRQEASLGLASCGQATHPQFHHEWSHFGKDCAHRVSLMARTSAIELRYAQGGPQQLPELAAELVRLKVDVIFASGDLAPKVAQQATETIPIVTIGDDILGARLITSLSRPGGNTTGLTILSPELSAKRLEVLRDIIPGLSRVTALWDPTTGASQVTMTTSAAVSLNLKLQVLEVRRREDVAGAVRAARNSQADALNVFSSPFLAALHREIIAFAAEHRLPAIYQWKEHAEAGGLVSYGPSLAAMWRQSAIIVSKVLKGAKPADLPVEQPSKLELVVNLRTAKSLDLTISPPVLLRADEVIE